MRILLSLLLLAAAGAGEPATRPVDYAHGDLPLRGMLALPAAATGPVPGVLVVHEWWGLNDYAQRRARENARRADAPV